MEIKAMSLTILNEIKEGKRDFSGVDWSGKYVSQYCKFLCGVNLQGANLAQANFISVSLKNANLQDANLTGADFMSAVLYQADLRGCTLNGVNFGFADLRFANFSGVDLTGVNLKNADIRGADFTGANLAGIDLRTIKLPWLSQEVVDSWPAPRV
jgi:uncharacterized protein YjbI with pentapeptide repeats